MSGSLAGAAGSTIVPPYELGWVAELLDLKLVVHDDQLGGGLDRLAGLALRRNPRRAHLLVSRLLGKHLPVDPREALAAAAQLAAMLPPEVLAAAPLVFGFAETATALGHAVATAVPGATYVSSTRRSGESNLDFEEAHSHATAHRVLAPRALLAGRSDDAGISRAALPPVVLVDDELSTGRTALNTIRALHALAPRPSWTVAALLDLRPAEARSAFDALADELGVPVHTVALLSGELHVPDDAAVRAASVVAAADPAARPAPEHPVRQLTAAWPAELPLGGRRGWGPELEPALDAALAPLAETVADTLSAWLPGRDPQVLVLGTEELMYVPMRLAAALADRLDAAGSGSPASVWNQSTTRSPVAPLDADGYAVRSALAFPAPDEPSRSSYVYNVAGRDVAGRADRGGYDAIVVVGDPATVAGWGPLLTALSGCAPVLGVGLPEVDA